MIDYGAYKGAIEALDICRRYKPSYNYRRYACAHPTVVFSPHQSLSIASVDISRPAALQAVDVPNRECIRAREDDARQNSVRSRGNDRGLTYEAGG